jgi:hypothetical protein
MSDDSEAAMIRALWAGLAAKLASPAEHYRRLAEETAGMAPDKAWAAIGNAVSHHERG